MDKIINFVLLSTLTLNISLVCGRDDENSLRTFAGYNQWNPIIKWRRNVFPLPVDYQRNAIYNSPDNYADDEVLESLDTIQNSEKMISKRTSSGQLKSPCELLSSYHSLGNGTDGYEYRPEHYITHSCLDSNESEESMCSKMGFRCNQIRLQIHITRRKIPSGNTKAVSCWEHVKAEWIDAACECNIYGQ